MVACPPSPPEHAVETPLPVTILTGFLGAGKTTLLNRMLADPAMADTAIVVNEFGSVGIDHHLVHAGQEQYMVTSTGCLCCTAGSDILTSLHQLVTAIESGVVPKAARIVVETTGLADPAPIVSSLLADGTQRFQLAAVVTAFDAVFGERPLDQHIECWKQLAFADHIVLTKQDLVQDPATRASAGALIEKVRALNPKARVWNGHDPGLDLAALLSDGSYELGTKPADVLAWLALERHSPSPHDHAHDPNRHGDRVRAVTFVEDDPLDPALFASFLSLLIGQPGTLRVKGLVKLADDPDRPLLVHAVQNFLHETRTLTCWPSEDQRSRLVVIGADLPPNIVSALFQGVRSRPTWWRRWRATG